MLTYKLKQENSDVKIYEFFPDGDKRSGLVAFYSDGNREVLRESPDDIIGWHKGHALWGIDLSTKSGTVAWY